MSSLPTSDITFSDLRDKYITSGNTNAINHDFLSDNGNSSVTLSHFRGATFTDGSSIPASGPISINSGFQNKTYRIKYDTGSFKVYSDWSASPTVLNGGTGSALYSGSDTANKRVQLNTGQPVGIPYPVILFTPNASSNSTSPGIIVDRSDANAVDEVTLWFKVVSEATYSQVQWGLIPKDMGLDNWTTQLQYMDDRYASYRDALRFQGIGRHIYAGSRDDITSSSTIVSPQYMTGTYGSNLTTNFHNIIGKTAGTLRSFNVPAPQNPPQSPGDADYFFYKTATNNYPNYRGTNILANLGMKLKWYSTTIQANLVSGSDTITPVSSTWSTDDLSNVFSGMYISGTGIPDESVGCFIGDIHNNSMKLYRERGVQSLTALNATASGTNITLTISGYLYWTLATLPSSYSDPVILGPPHTVLPRYQADSYGSNVSTKITEWGMFTGDTTSGSTNQFTHDIRDTDPTGTAFSYSVEYS
jgi:hypothetical protein